MTLVLGTLIAASNVPTTDPCSRGGYSWLNYLDAETGCGVGSTVSVRYVSSSGSDSMIVGVNVMRINGDIKGIADDAGGGHTPFVPPVDPGSFSGKRIGWREIVQ
jgi:hypothetical protein